MEFNTPNYITFNSYNISGKEEDKDGNKKTYTMSIPYAYIKNIKNSFPGVPCGTIQKTNFPYWKTVFGKCNNCDETDCDPTIEFADIGYRIIICKNCHETLNYNEEIIYSIAKNN